jgi:uncharacterized MAPEG superfamily protein
MSSFLRSVGLSFDGADFFSLNIKFVPLVFIAVNTVRIWPSTAIAQTFLGFVKSNVTEHVLHFALFYILLVWFHLSLGYIICVVLNKKDGYPNSAPRAYTASGAIFRTKSAAENTLESMVCFLVAITICDKLANEGAQELIASWAVLVILARTIYPGESYMICRQLTYFFFHHYALICLHIIVFYICDMDFLRTFSFGLSMFSYIFMCVSSLFPGFQSIVKSSA